MAEVEEAEITLNQLIPEASRRHISTVVESRITRQFTEVPQIEECAKQFKVTQEMVEDPNRQAEVKSTQLAASNCVRDKLSQVSDTDLEKMSENLGLKQHGLIKGTGSKAITEYLSSRFQNAFFAENKQGKLVPMVLDQKMFFDLYESQLGKSVLLEISNFCYNHVTIIRQGAPPGIPFMGNPSRKQVFDELNLPKGQIFQRVQNFSDTGVNFQAPTPNPQSTSGQATQPQNPNKIYEDFMTDVVGVSNGSAPTQAQQEKLSSIYENCGMLITPLCRIYEDCNCYYRKETATNQSDVTCTGTMSQSDYTSKCFNSRPTSLTPLPPPTRGSAACHIAGRMRGHRSNLTAVNRQQEILNNPEFYASDTKKGYKVDAEGKGPKIYTGGEQSLDDLTSLSTNQINEIAKQRDFDEQCAQNPDDQNCKDFVYTADEVAKFQNTAASYTAATQIESEKMRRMGSKSTDELRKFLVAKGYVDLVDELDGKTSSSGRSPRNSQDIAADAIQRFEAQREATFAEMSRAFERNQIAGQTDKNVQIEKIKDDYKNRPEDFKQLMLFNNVVTSFLGVEKKNSKGEFEKAGMNIKSLQREAEGNSALQGLLQFGGTSGLGANDSPIVDRKFIGSILGEEVEDSPP